MEISQKLKNLFPEILQIKISKKVTKFFKVTLQTISKILSIL